MQSSTAAPRVEFSSERRRRRTRSLGSMDDMNQADLPDTAKENSGSPNAYKVKAANKAGIYKKGASASTLFLQVTALRHATLTSPPVPDACVLPQRLSRVEAGGGLVQQIGKILNKISLGRAVPCAMT